MIRVGAGQELEWSEAEVRDGGRIEKGDVLLDAGELGRVLEFSAAPGIWPSCCRGIRERERV